MSVRLPQSNVRTEACGAERPLRSGEEHSDEEADEGTRGHLWIQRVTYVCVPTDDQLQLQYPVCEGCRTQCLILKAEAPVGS